MLVSRFPCIGCAKLIVDSGLSKVITYEREEQYRDDRGDPARDQVTREHQHSLYPEMTIRAYSEVLQTRNRLCNELGPRSSQQVDPRLGLRDS